MTKKNARYSQALSLVTMLTLMWAPSSVLIRVHSLWISAFLICAYGLQGVMMMVRNRPNRGWSEESFPKLADDPDLLLRANHYYGWRIVLIGGVGALLCFVLFFIPLVSAYWYSLVALTSALVVMLATFELQRLYWHALEMGRL